VAVATSSTWLRMVSMISRGFDEEERRIAHDSNNVVFVLRLAHDVSRARFTARGSFPNSRSPWRSRPGCFHP